VATSKDEIKVLLDEAELTYKHLEDDQPIWVTMVMLKYINFWQIEHAPNIPRRATHLCIELHENGEFLYLNIPFLYQATPGNDINGVLQFINSLNSTLKLAQHSFDPTDGEIKMSAEIALEDNGITFTQLHRYITALFNAVDSQAEEWREVLSLPDDFDDDPPAPGSGDDGDDGDGKSKGELIELFGKFLDDVYENR
jgi:hypothetical protein